MNPNLIQQRKEQLRDRIEARHVAAATHKQAYEIEETLIAKDCEELEQLLLLEQREALRAKAEENALAVGPQKGRWG